MPGDRLKSTRLTLPGDRLGTPSPVCVDSDLVTEVAEALGRRLGLESRVVSWASSRKQYDPRRGDASGLRASAHLSETKCWP